MSVKKAVAVHIAFWEKFNEVNIAFGAKFKAVGPQIACETTVVVHMM